MTLFKPNVFNFNLTKFSCRSVCSPKIVFKNSTLIRVYITSIFEKYYVPNYPLVFWGEGFPPLIHNP